MKLGIIIFFSIFFGFTQAQDIIGVSELGGTAIKAKALHTSEVVGTPYLNKEFMNSQIDGINDEVMLRFNANTGNMEFERDGMLYELSGNLYPVVYYGPLKQKYFFTNFNAGNTDVQGYLQVILELDKIKLYKREVIEFYKAKEASNSYTESTPNMYKSVDPEYYLSYNNSIIIIPSNKKKFAAIFKNNEKDVLKFIKENNISLNNENEIISVLKYLNSI